MPSVVIAAHNEEAVIGACLDALAVQTIEAPLDVIVSANGCTDATVTVAERRGARVVDRREPGKAAAINAAEASTTAFPRIYLDADIVVPPHTVEALSAQLAQPGILATVPRRRLELTGRPWAVRSYFAINERLPAFRSGLFGRGVIALSAEGRSRFSTFPELVADDLFLDSQFAEGEKAVTADVEVVVETPLSTAALVRRLIRVRRGNAQMRSVLEGAARPSDRWAWLRDVVLPEPRLLPAAVPYLVITIWAGLRARRSRASDWGRDDTTRTARPREEGELR